MAKKKSKMTEPTEPANETNDDSYRQNNDLSEKLFRLIAEDQRGKTEKIVPVLYGRTGSSKTARVEQWIAECHHDEYVFRPLVAAVMPEELTGVLRADPAALIARFLPLEGIYELKQRPGIMFLDELGHCRGEVRPALLTLMYQCRIQEHVLHPGTIVVGAQQPVDPELLLATEEGQALAARCCFLPLTNDWRWVERETGIAGYAEAFTQRDASEPLPLPTVPANSRTAYWGLSLIKRHSLSLDEARAVLYGIMKEQDANLLVSALEAAGWGLDVQAAIRAGRGIDVVDRLSVPELCEAVGSVLLSDDPRSLQVYERMLMRVWTSGKPDLAREFLKRQIEQLREAAGQATEIEVFSDRVTVEDVAQVIKRVRQNLDQIRARQKEGKV